MQETLKKKSSDATEPVDRSVTLCVRENLIILNGAWRWEMESTAVYCSDVMHFPPDFEGTKGIVHPDDLAKVFSAVEFLRDDELASLDFRIITTWGEVKNLSGSRVSLEKPAAEEEAKKDRWEGPVRELALRKEAEALIQRTELADAAERLHSIGSFAVNKSTGEAWYSDGMYRIYGLPPQSLNTHPNTFNIFLHPDDRVAVTDALEAAYAQEVPVHLEYRIVPASGQTRTVRLVTQWLYNGKGEALFSGVLRDTTGEHELINKIETAEQTTKLHQQVLRFSEGYWNTAYWFINLVTRKVTYSENYHRIYGLKHQHLPNKNAFLNLVHPDDRERLEGLVEQMFRQHVLPEAEFRIIRPDGKQRQLKQSGKVFINGNDLVMVGAVQDVTVQRGLEKKIAEWNDKSALHEAIQSITENLTETSFITWYPEGNIHWSEGFCRLLGYKAGSVEPSQRLLHRQIHPEDLKKFKDAETLITNGQMHESFRFRIANKGGHRQLFISFQRLTAGNREVVVGVVQDITRELALHQKLTETTRYGETLNDAVSDMVLLTDTENTVLAWNRCAAEKTGIKEEDALYSNLFDLFPTLKQEDYLKQLQTVVAGSEVRELKVRNRYLQKPHHYYLVPLRNESGEVTRLLHVVQDVSRELDLQQQLSERLNFIESLVEASVDRIVVLDRHMNYVYWNKRAEEHYAISKNRVIGRNILEIFPGLRADPSYAEFRKVLRGETVHLPATVQEGNDDYFETYLIPVKDEKGEAAAILWIVHDLSKERQLQEERNRTSELLQATMDAATEMIQVFEAVRDERGEIVDFRYILLNHEAEKWMPGAVGKSLLQLQPGVLEEGIFDTFKKVVETGISDQRERHYVHEQFNGWFHQSVVKLNDGVATTTRDITDRKKAEEEVKQQAHFLQRITDTGPHMISVIELATGDTSFFNAAVFEASGFDPDKMNGRTPEEKAAIIYPDDRPTLAAYFGSFLTASDEDTMRAEYRAKTDSGVWRWFFVNGKVFQRSDEGKPTHVLNVIEDITARKKVEAEVVQTKEFLKATLDSSPYFIQAFQAVRNEAGKIIDFTWIFTNHIWNNHYGDVIGKSLLQQNPAVIETGLFNKFVQVTETGVTIDHEQYYSHEQFHEQWFHQTLVKMGDGFVMNTEDITERKKAQDEILRLKDELAQNTTDKYQALFKSIDEGFYLCEVIFDANKQAVDIRYIEENPAAVRMIGMSFVGKTLKEINPAYEPYWYQIWRDVALTGESRRIEQYSDVDKKWFDFHIARVGSDESRQVTVVFQDITERKAWEEQQAFLLRFSDAVTHLNDSVEVQMAAMRILAEHLGLSRAAYWEVQEDGDRCIKAASFEGDLPPVPNQTRISDFSAEQLTCYITGKPFVVSDTETDERVAPMKEACRAICVRAWVGVPLQKNGRLRMVLGVEKTTPHNWTYNEIQLLQEVAERTWAAAERAKAEEALRISEAKFRRLSESGLVAVAFFNIGGPIVDANDAFLHLLGVTRDELQTEKVRWDVYTAKESMPRTLAAIEEFIQTGYISPYEKAFYHTSGELRWGIFAGATLGDGKTGVSLVVDITERKKAEEALRHSEQRLQKAFSIETVGVIYFNLDGVIHDANVAFERMSGWSKEELASGNVRWDELTPPEFMEATLKSREEFLTAGQNTPYEKEYIRPDGSRWWGLFAGKRLSEEECVEFVVDITEKKKAEEALRHFSALLEQQVAERTQELQKNLTLLSQTETIANIGSWDYDLATSQFNWSDGMYRIFDYPKGTIIRPEEYLDRAVDEERAAAKRIVKSIKKTHQPFEETIRINRKDGTRLLKVKGTILFDEKGEPQKVVGVDRDITHIKAAEEQLAQSQYWLEQTAKASPDAITIYNLQKKEPVYLNDCLAHWTGVPLDKLVSMGIEGRLQLVHPDDRLPLLHFNEKITAAKDGEVLMMEYRIQAGNENLRWLRNRSKVFSRDKNGKVTHMLSILQDVTEEKEAEARLKELNESLEAKNKDLENKNEEITSFAFVASHDLKEPLRKIQTFSDWLLTKEESLSENGRQSVERLINSVKRLDTLVDDIVALTKVHVENANDAEINLNNVLKIALANMQDVIDRTKAKIVADDLPVVNGVENHLLYLFKNLLSNAIKFQPTAQKPVITISASRENDFLVLSFADNGIGFAPEQSKRIFQMFRRLHGRTEFEGTGMGLAICKKIMERHGGFIKATGSPGNGAVFSCHFPRQRYQQLKKQRTPGP